jgi:hypothetical protein
MKPRSPLKKKKKNRALLSFWAETHLLAKPQKVKNRRGRTQI